MAEVVTLITAVVVLVTVMITAVATWRTRRQVREVHVMVNSQRAEMVEELKRYAEQQAKQLARLDQLTAALETSDTAVPPAHEDTDREGS